MSEKTLIILASNSPRRRQLLSLAGWMFNVLPMDVDERVRPGEKPADYVLRLAEVKARACAAAAHKGYIIVAADTTVADGGNILGKPKSMTEASEMLTRLRGRTHQVYSAIAALGVSDSRLFTDLCITDVTMRNYSLEEMADYVATGDPLDKAGGYAIQHPQFQPVEGLQGCYASVMGLPLCHLVRTLREMEIAQAADVRAGCLDLLHYSCLISPAVMRGEQVGRS